MAGPLNSDAVGYIQNMSKMLRIGVELRRRGHAPFIPCLDILLGILDGEMVYDDYVRLNLPFVDVCDALFLIAHSPGADQELARAEEMGKIIFHTLEEVPDASIVP